MTTADGIDGKFKALVARDGVVTVEDADASVLFDDDDAVTVRVAYSCINYKDALAVTGKGKILRASPMVPGIDYAGAVTADGGGFKKGDKVVLTGWGVGEKASGGFAEVARAKAKWLLPLPPQMTEKQAMICGTAGLTAALCAQTLKDAGVAAGGEVAVSGASGGVGSFAVRLLAKMGYRVTAISRAAAAEYLKTLGAAEVVPREEMAAAARPLEKSRWHGAVDCTGGAILARLLAEMQSGGAVAACGLAGGVELQTTVMPFILRGARLLGVDSVYAAAAAREAAWGLLAQHMQAEDYAHIHAATVPLAQVAARCEEVLGGNVSGRFLVDPAA